MVLEKACISLFLLTICKFGEFVNHEKWAIMDKFYNTIKNTFDENTSLQYEIVKCKKVKTGYKMIVSIFDETHEKLEYLRPLFELNLDGTVKMKRRKKCMYIDLVYK